MKCPKCHKKIKNFRYRDDDGQITATCKCGNIITWISAKRKIRKPITKKWILSHIPAMAIFKNGKLVKSTEQDIADCRAYLLSEAERIDLIK